MLIDRRWWPLLSLLAAAAFAVPALAQPAPDGAAPPGAVKKPPKPKPKSAPAITGTADPAPAAVGGVKPTLLGQYGDWGAYAATPGGKKVCFALGKPKTAKTEPEGRKRDPAYLFVSIWLDRNVKNEVSIIIGYPFKTSSDATACLLYTSPSPRDS